MNDYKPLENAILKTLSYFPYYGQLIVGMDKQFSDEIPIAAVKVTSRVVLMINPKMFNVLPLHLQVGILIHECMHIIHDHISRGIQLKDSHNHQIINIAADRAVNEKISLLAKNNKVISDIPDEFILPNGESIKPITKKNFADQFPQKQINDNDTLEYYYSFLKQNCEKMDIPGLDTLDDHSQWEKGNGNAEATRQIVKSALETAAKKCPGNVPGDVQDIIDAMNRSTVSWQSVLQRFIAKATLMDIDSSRKRVNRRYGIIHPGNIKEPKLRLGVAIDTSGSVSNQCLSQFIPELNKIHSMGIEILLVQCDSQVTTTPVEYTPKSKLDIKGRGGTTFQPAINALEKENVDCIVYMTDGENYDELKVKKPILWCLCPNYTIPKGFTENQCVKITIPEN